MSQNREHNRSLTFVGTFDVFLPIIYLIETSVTVPILWQCAFVQGKYTAQQQLVEAN